MPSSVRDIGAVAEFAEGRPCRVELDRRALVVVRRGEEFFALRDACPHQGARLSGGRVGGTALNCAPGEPIPHGRAGEILTCPWHGWEFDLCSGRSLTNPRGVRVRAYPAWVEADRVLVDLG